MIFSICMLTCNNLKQVQECLPTLDVLLARPDVYELLILDNGSTDGTQEWLVQYARERSPTVTLILEPENLGCGAARARLFNMVVGDYILSLDSDVKVKDDILAKLVVPFETAADIGIVGDHGADIKPQWNGVNNLSTPGKPYRGYCHTVSGYCLMFPRKVLEAGINTCGDYGPYWLDDGELCFQIRTKLGLKAYALPCDVEHRWSKTNAGGMKEFEQAFGRFRDKWRPLTQDWIK